MMVAVALVTCYELNMLNNPVKNQKLRACVLSGIWFLIMTNNE